MIFWFLILKKLVNASNPWFPLERQRYVLKLSIWWITNRTRCVATSSPQKIVGYKRKDFNSTVCCALSVIEVNYLHLHNTSVFISGVYIEQHIIKVAYFNWVCNYSTLFLNMSLKQVCYSTFKMCVCSFIHFQSIHHNHHSLERILCSNLNVRSFGFF